MRDTLDKGQESRGTATGAVAWLEVSVEADRSAVDDVVSLLGRCCMGGAVVDERPGDGAAGVQPSLVVKGYLPPWDDQTRNSLEVALLLLSRAAPISEPRFTLLAPEDWAESWKAYFPRQHIGRHTVIVPTWLEYAPQPGEMILKLDPGMAFGTGLHATTRLCLAAIEQYVVPGAVVLDVGTGSGILAISAALHGASTVRAIDIDPVAVEVARANVSLNRCAGIVTVSQGTLSSIRNGIPVHSFRDMDVVLVNIFAEVIIAMAPVLASTLHSEGTLLASGILSEKADAVASALARVGLVVSERQDEDGWVALVATKR